MIALTGSSGVLGTAMRQRWPDVDWSPLAGDIRDFDSVRDWISALRPEAAIHLAAIVPVGRVESDPRAAFLVNVQGTVNVCEALRLAAPEAWLFVASSSHVYQPRTELISEESLNRPATLYGTTKLLAEEVALGYARHFGLRICVGRIFSFSSALQSGDYLLPSLVSRLRACERSGTLRLRGADQVRDFLTTGQVAEIIDFLRRRSATGVINIASGQGIRLGDLAMQLAHRMGRGDVTIVPDDDTDASLVADVSKLERLGWKPRPDIDRLLDEMVQYE
jgi:nucleoside-diphosphate-sugar epimerase